MKGGIGDVILLIILIVLVIVVIFMFKDFFINLFYKFMGLPGVAPTVQGVQQAGEAIYKSLSTVYTIITNPYGYAAQFYQPSQPAQQVAEYQYSISLQSPSINTMYSMSYSNNIAVTNPIVLPYILSYYIPSGQNYEYPADLECENSLANVYGNCTINFQSTSSASPSSLLLQSSGMRIVICSIPSIEFNLTQCPYLYGNSVYLVNELKIILHNINTYTVYRALVADENIVAYAVAEEESIYNILGLNPSSYDTGVYYGLLNFPKIDISRAGFSTGFPMIIFNASQPYYDVFYIYLKYVSNIVDIKDFNIKLIYDPSKINVLYFNNGECTDNFFLNLTYYWIDCNGNECNIGIDQDLWNFFRENSQLGIVGFIPVCVTPNTNFREYTDIAIIANVTYDYELTSSMGIEYVPLTPS